MIGRVARDGRIKQTEGLNDAGNLKVKRVLIYRLGSLGDTVVALPALHLVARAFPTAERRMLTNVPLNSKAPSAAAVLDRTGLVDSYFEYPLKTRSLRELVSLWWRLVLWRPHVVVYLAASRGIDAAKRDARFFKLCGIPRQVGVPLTDAMQKNLLAEGDGSLEPEAIRLLRNLSELGDGRVNSPASWDLRLTQAEITKARELLAPSEGMALIAVSVGTKVQSKDWGAANWRALLLEMAKLYQGYALVMCGAAEEFAVSEAAAEGWRATSPDTVINLCGKLSPRESAAVFAEAKIFIGHDSGPMHLAAAVQTTCVAIFSARTKPRVWFPYGNQHRVIYHQVDCWGCRLETCVVEKKKCLTSISVAEVMAEVGAVLGQS